MLTETLSTIKITKTTKSRLAEVDFNKLAFGHEFTDHMLVAHYKNGVWGEPEIIPYGNLSISPASSVLHYGQAIFEGMKAHRTMDGSIAMFRPEKNFERFNKSAVRMSMPEIPEYIFMEGLKKLVDLDRQWVPDKDGYSLYIRPVLFANDNFIGVKTAESYMFFIILGPAGSYYGQPVSVLASENYSRAEVGGVGYAKTAGNYAKTLMPMDVARKQGYKEVMWMGGEGHKFIQEIGAMNVFFIIDGKVVTPEIDGTFLEGITRDSVIQIAKDLGYEVIEKHLSIDEVMQAGREGKLQEAFGTGTAAVVNVISKIAYRDEEYELGTENKIANQLKKELEDIKINAIPDRHGWLLKV